MSDGHSTTERSGSPSDVESVTELRLQNDTLRSEASVARDSILDLSQELSLLQGTMKANGAARRAGLNLIEDAVLARQAAMRETAQRRVAEAKLRGNEERLRRMLNIEAVGVLVFDRAGVLIEANDAFLKLTGYSREEVEARQLDWRRMTPPEYVAESERQLEVLAATGRAGPYEKEYYHKDGSRSWMFFAGADLGDGTIVEYVIDIADRKRAEAALRFSEERLRMALQAARVGTWSWNIERDVHHRDANLHAMFGLPAVETEEPFAAFLKHIHPDDRAHVTEEFDRSVQHGHNLNIDFRTVWPDGTVRWLRDQGDVFGSEDGKYMSGACLDITERRQLEDELRYADRRKDEFLATLAHELRNPLAAIHASAQIMQSPKSREATRTTALEILGRQVTQMQRLIDDMLEVSRLIQGKISIRPQRIVLQEHLKEAVAAIESTTLRDPCHVKLTIPEERIELLADPVRVQQVFSNLLTNAVKYSREECHIEIRCWVENEMVVVAVRDQGVGISPDMLPHVFDLFVQAGHLSDRSDAGLGLGLTVVRDLVEKHGGRVEAFSEGPNCGSEFRVYLPMAHPDDKQ
jgi:PAS domain S-box-containing protein